MRYLNLILLVILMLWSWSAIHKPSATSERDHWELQEELKQIITEQVAARTPYPQNIQFKNLWTENLKADKVKAFFHYSYESSSTAQIQGYAILQRKPGEPSPWAVIKIHIFNESIIFKDGTHLSPSDN